MGIVSLILLATLVFYLGRDFFLRKAVTYLNEQQPGEVRMGNMYFIPFMNFPNVTLHLRSVKFYEKEVNADTTDQEPILSLEEIGVTLDLMELIRGGIKVSEANLKDGYVHLIIYNDSISNLEHALGIRFSDQSDNETPERNHPIAIDLNQIELLHVETTMDNRLEDDYLSMEVNRIESSFSYLSGEIEAAIEVDIDVDSVKYLTVNNKTDKNIFLKGSILLNPEERLLRVDPSSLRFSGLEFETWGSLDYRATPRIDFAYTATNEGLELLNYLFRGILDLDEIEQIGGGSIHMNGTVQGAMGGDELPVVRVNGDAEDLGFRIKSVGEDVTGISFHMFATNGGKSDLSEGHLEVQDFKAQFPEGSINANITANNVRQPELKVEVDSRINLAGMDEMLNKKSLTGLSGAVAIQGEVSVSVNTQSGQFINEGGSLEAVLDDVSFVLNRDGATRDSLKHISGEFILKDSIIGSEGLSLEYNGNHFNVDLFTENLLLYLLDYNRDVTAGISISSDLVRPAALLGDTTVSSMVGEEVEDFYLRGRARIENEALDDFIKLDSVPVFDILLDSFAVSMPMMARISDMSASLTFGPDTVLLHHLAARIGESSLGFSGALNNYGALAHADSGEVVELEFDISSDTLRAEDLLTINNEFLLPQNFRTEYLKDLRLTGSLKAPAAGLVYDSIPMDFGLDITQLGWGLRYYPDRFKNFLINIQRDGDLLLINNIQGSVGENNLNLSASIGNFNDTVLENMYGSFELYSDLLDFNQLLNYQAPHEGDEVQKKDTSVVHEPIRLYDLEYPQFDFTVDIGEVRYENHRFYDLNGKFRSSKNKIFYLDKLETSPEGRGTISFDGLINVASPEKYTVSAEVNLNGININDLNLEFQSGDTILAMKDHFLGIVDGRGLAEIFITPELKVDMPTTTAAFNVKVTDGALINFTPLQVAGKYLDSKDLNNVRFATVRNSFTLVDSRITIPIMNIESSLGQMLIQGEQGLDMSYLYLVHVPPKLAMSAARSAMSERAKEDGVDQVNQMKRGDYLVITIWSNGTDSDFKLGDRRNRFQK